MLRDDVERALRDDYGEDGRIFPAYGDRCFGAVPDTVRSILDAGGRRPLPEDVLAGVDTDVSTVVLVLVDGYGLDAWKRDRDRVETVGRLTERGTVTPLTTIYPSETAAAITTLETGRLPCEHGRIGWNVFEPETDRTFRAFDGRVKSDTSGTTPSAAVRPDDDHGYAPESELPGEGIYPDLAERGIDAHRLQPFEEQDPGVTQHTYDGLSAFGAELTRAVEESDDPAYVYGYLPDVDKVAHEVGTESDAFDRTVTAVFEQVSSAVAALDPETAAETLVLVTADHGHVDTDPGRNVDLDERPALIDALRRHGDGQPVRTAGNPRNVHLHLRESPAVAREALADLDALTTTREAALDRALFGDREPSERFRRRCGDLVLTHRDLGTWFGAVEPGKLEMVGMHGGLHPEEMLVPFAAARADRLQ